MVKERLAAEADRLAPWFFAAMPPYYFRTHSPESRCALHALISGQVLSEGQRLAVKSPCGGKVTYLSPGRSEDDLVEVLASLRGREILNARIYESVDGRLRLDTFVLAPQAPLDAAAEGFRQALDRMRGHGGLDPGRAAAFAAFLAGATGDCVEKFEPERALRHFALWEEFATASDREQVLVRLTPEAYPGLSRVDGGLTSPARRGLLLEMARHPAPGAGPRGPGLCRRVRRTRRRPGGVLLLRHPGRRPLDPVAGPGGGWRGTGLVNRWRATTWSAWPTRRA
jgi:glutamate dehydrogenase